MVEVKEDGTGTLTAYTRRLLASLQAHRRARSYLSPQLLKVLCSATVAMLVGLATVGVTVSSGTAQATTGDNVGLPPPPKLMDAKYAYPLVGRFYLASIGRKAHIMSGQLDVEVQGEGEPEWFYGEFEAHSYGSHGTSTVVESLWYFKHSKGRVSARLVAPASVTNEKPFGITVGRISFAFPRGATTLLAHNKEPKELQRLSGYLTLNGKTVKVAFKRGSDDAPPPDPLPRAKQTGKE